LKHYVTALQGTTEGSSTDQRLREKIIKLVQRLDPPPAIPEEAERYMGRGQAAFKLAQSEADYKQAVPEFQRALRLAPWWAAAYFNLGLAQEKAGEYNAAIRSLKLYLLAAPNAPDAGQVRAKIGEIEYKQEAAARPAERLAGIWSARTCFWEHLAQEPPGLPCSWGDETYRIEAKGATFRAILISTRHGFHIGTRREGDVIFEGSLDGDNITGIYILKPERFPDRRCLPPGNVPLRGKLEKNLNTIVMNFDYVMYVNEVSWEGCRRGYFKHILTRQR
jgi:tetratricopeptide (TPR) repeat protein